MNGAPLLPCYLAPTLPASCPPPSLRVHKKPCIHRPRHRLLSLPFFFASSSLITLAAAFAVSRAQARESTLNSSQLLLDDRGGGYMWARPPYAKGGGVEAGVRPLYPVILEPPELRWVFIRKIYTILSIQMIITVVTARPVSDFFVSSGSGLGLYIFLIILPFFVICPLYYYCQHHPLNYILLGVFTVSISFAVGLTQVVLFPMGRIFAMIYGGLAAIIFCGFIIYDTDNLIKRYSYDEYIWAVVSLYLDIINLFLSLLTLFGAADN